MDAAAGGAFLSLTIAQASALVEKMASNQGWSDERIQTCKRGGGMHQLKEVDMLATKMDLLIKKLDERAIEKKEVMHIHDSSISCEEYGETGHTGTNCPELMEDMNYINNNNNNNNNNKNNNLPKSLHLIKKDDPSVPTILSSISRCYFYNTVCDTITRVNIMAKVTYEFLYGTMPNDPTYAQLQLVDQSFLLHGRDSQRCPCLDR